MNEKQWDTERRHAQSMTHTLVTRRVAGSKVGRRKLRLFACGCCRLAWHHLTDERLRAAVELAERFADGLEDKAALALAAKRVEGLSYSRLYPNPKDQLRWTAASLAVNTVHASASNAAFMMTAYSPSPVVEGKPEDAERVLCDLLRCVFGNPFRKPEFGKKWRSETVTALAKGIYGERAFDRLPILADALEEAGCDDPTMLAHLRGDGPHCRGCWVLDLALGK